MPKQPGKITKHLRLERLHEFIRARKRVRTADVKEFYMRDLGEVIERTVNRDLLDLEEANIARRIRMDSEGLELEEEESEKARKGKSDRTFSHDEWVLFETETAVLGEGLLTDAGGVIFQSDSLKGETSVTEAGKKLREGVVAVEFRAGNNTLVLSLPKQALPISVYFGSCSKKVSEGDFFKCVKEKRVVVIQLLNPNLSSYRMESRLGHMVIQVRSETEVCVQDLGSTNGTSVRALSSSELKTLQEDRLGKLKTVNLKDWLAKIGERSNSKELKALSPSTTKLPCEISAGNDFSILVYS